MLTAIEQKQLANYERLAAMPKWKYILLYGVLAWGITVGIIVSLVNMLINKTSFSYMLRHDLLINLIGFPVGGIIFGLFMRNFIPRQIKRLKAKESQPL